MKYYPAPMKKLIAELSRLPGVGPKSAQRLAFHLFASPREEVLRLASAMIEAKDKLAFCKICGHLTDETICQICRDETRDRTLLCVVEEPKDLIALEKTREFRGIYHVLHGALSPLEGIGPEELRIKELLARVEKGGFREIILANNPNVEGETTALYLVKLLKPFNVKLTRLARGLPVGGDLEYIDEVTLGKALEGRDEL
jgi:recombination protein RecR